MQLPYRTDLSGQQYVTQKDWHHATIIACPNHPKGGCRFHRHGTYVRKTPWGLAHVVRYYCRDSHQTFSLLPDCFAARMPGTLDELEQVALRFEAGDTPKQVTESVRENCHIEDSGKRRWSFRREFLLTSCLTVIVTLLALSVVYAPVKVSVLRERLGTDRALVELRRRCMQNLHNLPPPIGFRPP